ncbi:hypothetical protein M775_03675 [Neisseria gonorrhoeae MU_NG6]|uniref:Uncharacterized protein n=1 Tax=Neisseria gonorrhoeae TaxID=485 RepID=A0AB38HMC3_NEIGO|nr:hypothetical protein M723_10465 [Neisseria gonorrhoeae ATL_2011_01_03]KLS78168.1 hypothetical protein M771_09575 [Neisseria gonorrhoeae MU_NG1]KLS89456.1 hypothetical protein M775_03675 [Neisseria gonorrhoeae MU_NG6]SBN10113.1 Uncharacterised protein [Neisseria gonorrhoeae]SBQ20852.1 Uncharacterised protein [Neisseria gonorrhoeae]
MLILLPPLLVNIGAWIDFLLALDRDYLQMAIEYVNELEI